MKEVSQSVRVVVRVYKEEGNIDEFLRRVRPLLNSITRNWEVIFALDPSPDRTGERILEARSEDDRIKLLEFSRRFGQPMATLAGLQYAKGEAVIVIDVDLQDPPELITTMVENCPDSNDTVHAHRTIP